MPAVPAENCQEVPGLAPGGPAPPAVIRFQKRGTSLGNNEVDDGSSAACETCCRAAVKIVDCDCSHKGQLHMGVGVDAAWHDKLAGSIND